MRQNFLIFAFFIVWSSSSFQPRRRRLSKPLDYRGGWGSKKKVTKVPTKVPTKSGSENKVVPVGTFTLTFGIVLWTWIDQAWRTPEDHIFLTLAGSAYFLAAMGPIYGAVIFKRTVPAKAMIAWILAVGTYPALGYPAFRFLVKGNRAANLWLAAHGALIGTWLLGLGHYLEKHQGKSRLLDAFFLLTALPIVAAAYIVFISMAFATDYLLPPGTRRPTKRK